jgi:Mg2+-importing ATPase
MVDSITIFAKHLSPVHKERIIHALQRNGKWWDTWGDGINDALALKSSACQYFSGWGSGYARSSADIILIGNQPAGVERWCGRGAQISAILPIYIKMAGQLEFRKYVSASWGASAFLPFVPMCRSRSLTNNLLYDFSQTTIPSDEVGC